MMTIISVSDSWTLWVFMKLTDANSKWWAYLTLSKITLFILHGQMACQDLACVSIYGKKDKPLPFASSWSSPRASCLCGMPGGHSSPTVPHIYALVKRVDSGSDNGLSPIRHQAIIWTNAGMLLIGPLGTNFSEILIESHTFSLKEIHLKISSAKCQPF